MSRVSQLLAEFGQAPSHDPAGFRPIGESELTMAAQSDQLAPQGINIAAWKRSQCGMVFGTQFAANLIGPQLGAR